ncbi:MAG: translocation/assembly module TamB domain-containing protein [Calditrichae bacterium]|nr:translocation/assembly module TamB domain-containing protein [Calditrichia bacterium]
MPNKPVSFTKRFLKISAKISLYIFLAVFLLIGITILLYWQTNWVAKGAEKYINYTLPDSVKVKYSAISGTILNNIEVDHFRLELKDKLKLKSNRLKLKYDLWAAIFDKKIVISSIDADSVFISMVHDKKLSEQKERKPFDLDSLLYNIQNSHLVDTLLAKMPELELDNFEIRAAQLSMTGSPLTVENIYLNFNAFFKPNDFQIRLNKLSAYWKERDLKLDKLGFQIVGNRDRITINQFHALFGESSLNLAAEVDLKDLNTLLFIEDIYFDPGNFHGFLPENYRDGYFKGKVSFIGSFQDFAVNADISGKWQQYNLRRMRLVSDYSYGKINIDTLIIGSSAGDLFLKTKINTTSSAKGLLTFKGLNSKAIKPEMPNSNVNGKLTFNIPPGNFNINKLAASLKRISAEGELELYPSGYAEYKLDSLRFALKANKGDVSVVQPSFIKFANQARFDMYGDLKRNRELDFQIHSDAGNLNNLMTAIGIDSMFGDYHTDFRAFGKLEDPQIKGYFWIKDFKFDKVFLDSMGLQIDLAQVMSSPKGTGNFKINKGTAYDIPLRDVILTATKDENLIKVPVAKIFSDDNYIETALDIWLKKDSIEIDIAKLRLEYQKYWLQNKAPISVMIDSQQVAVNNFELDGPDQTLMKVNGFYDKVMNDASANLDLKTINLAPFRQFLGEKHKASGIISGYAKLGSVLQNPDIEINIAGKNIEYGGVKFGDLQADLEYDTSKVFIREFSVKSEASELNAEGDLDIHFDMNTADIVDLIRKATTDVKINWKNIDLKKYNSLLNLDKPLYGNLNGYLEIEGTVGDPFMRQSLRAYKFRYDKVALDSLIMFGQYSAGYLILDSLSTNFQGTSLAAKGWQQLDLGFDSEDTVFTDNPFEFFIFSKDNDLSFIGMFNDQLESINGDYDMEIYLTGTPEKPSVNRGKITLDNGNVLLSRVKDPIKNVNADITIEDNILTINRFDAKSEKEEDFLEKTYNFISKLWTWMLPERQENGVLAVNGTINLENVFHPAVNLDISSNKFFVDYFVENTKLLVTMDDLKVKGRDSIIVSGKIIIPSGEYEVNVAQMQKNMYLQPSQIQKKPPFIGFDLELEIPGNFVITSSPLDLGNNFKIIMLGNLNVTQEAGSDKMSIIGTMETESGTFTSFNQRFNVSSGTIDFSNPNRLNPEFNITAQKNLRDKVFELVITGNLETINQNIVVKDESTGEELNLSPQDKIALLTLGTDISGVASNTDSTLYGVGEDVAKNTLITAATRGVEELTGLDKVEINSSDKIIDLQKMKLNNGLKEASISFGKYLTSDLYVEYRTQFGNGVPTPKLSWDAGNKITLQYKIDQQWSLESNYEKTIPLGNNKIKVGLSWEYTF